jgi:diguanylate cyclase (GGDEF)-like protein
MQLEIARAQRYTRRFGIMLIDIDHVPDLIASHGSAAAGRVQVEIARMVQHGALRLRRSDFAARGSGHELCIVLPETDVAGTLTKAERIRQGIEVARWEALAPDLGDGRDGKVPQSITVSIGVAMFPEHGTTTQDLLAAASAALAQARSAGNNNVGCARPASA